MFNAILKPKDFPVVDELKDKDLKNKSKDFTNKYDILDKTPKLIDEILRAGGVIAISGTGGGVMGVAAASIYELGKKFLSKPVIDAATLQMMDSGTIVDLNQLKKRTQEVFSIDSNSSNPLSSSSSFSDNPTPTYYFESNEARSVLDTAYLGNYKEATQNVVENIKNTDLTVNPHIFTYDEGNYVTVSTIIDTSEGGQFASLAGKGALKNLLKETIEKEAGTLGATKSVSTYLRGGVIGLIIGIAIGAGLSVLHVKHLINQVQKDEEERIAKIEKAKAIALLKQKIHDLYPHHELIALSNTIKEPEIKILSTYHDDKHTKTMWGY